MNNDSVSASLNALEMDTEEDSPEELRTTAPTGSDVLGPLGASGDKQSGLRTRHQMIANGEHSPNDQLSFEGWPCKEPIEQI